LNLRRLSRQIYSLIPLTTREPHPIFYGADTPNRTEDILITSEMLYQLSYIGLSFRATMLQQNDREIIAECFRFIKSYL
jgi:hypothetical protein